MLSYVLVFCCALQTRLACTSYLPDSRCEAKPALYTLRCCVLSSVWRLHVDGALPGPVLAVRTCGQCDIGVEMGQLCQHAASILKLVLL